MHGSYYGFEYAAQEARRELLEEARRWRLARQARPEGGLRGRVARLLAGLRTALRPRTVVEEIPLGGAPNSVYVEREAGRVVEVYPGGGGRVLRRTDLSTGASTDVFLVDGRVKR